MQNEALDVLIQAVEVATKKGCYTLKDCDVLIQAIKVLKPEQPAEPTINKEEE